VLLMLIGLAALAWTAWHFAVRPRLGLQTKAAGGQIHQTEPDARPRAHVEPAADL
jgi:hypothetical protein